MLLEGKKALVTGARRGIGRAIAAALASEGCDVGINDHEIDSSARDTETLVRSHGREALLLEADVASASAVAAMVERFLSAFGRIDIMVNNAASWRMAPFLEITEEDWDRYLGVALKGVFLGSQAAARAMAKGGGGSIVSIASVHAYRAWPDDTVYGIAKAGVVRMTMSMALDLGDHGIRCNAVAPGYIDSRLLPEERERERGRPEYRDQVVPHVPSRRIGVPDDIARAVVYLCSPQASYVNGTCLLVDGGFLTQGTPAD
jgi:NAD(P)-dependent dehydrogenase (short-subunit alcohol dehydrogenase family)